MARVAYYLWRFPVLSETFIQRELRALAARGVDVVVVADMPDEEGNRGDAEASYSAARVRYLLPVAPLTLAGDVVTWLVRRPLRMLRLFAYTRRQVYREPKTLRQDVRVFLKAVYLAAVLRRTGIDHVHCPWGDVNAFVAIVAARLAGTGFSLQFRAHDLHRRTSAFLIAEKIRQARFIVTNTDYNLAILQAAAAAEDRGRIHRIYNGLELARLPPLQDRARGDMIRLLSVGRLIEQKGFTYLFEAIRLLRDRGYPVTCRVIGAPELPAYRDDFVEIQEVRRRLGLEESVELLGALPFPAVARSYHDADIFVLPCVIAKDGSPDIIPNTLLEAMAVGLPVVSTTVTAVPEMVENGVSGILVPPRDAVAVADAIARLIDDPSLAARLGDAARRRVHERFDIEKNIGSYVELFARL